MGTYHHGNLRAALVDAAVGLAQASGADGVVLREAARRTGVSHNAAYRHFADRDALLAAVAEAAMERLGEAMRAETDTVEVQEPVARAVARLRATGRAYVHFALTEPGLFEVAFAAPVESLTDAPVEPASEDGPAGLITHPYDLLGQMLDELVDAGAVTAERREGAEVLCWSAVHGFAVLHRDGPLREVPAAERDASLELLLDQVQGGLL